MNSKQYEGLIKASPEKRYKSFLNTVADEGEIWFLASEEGNATIEIDGTIYLLVWPREEFCSSMIYDEDEKAVFMDIYEFLEECRHIDENIEFMVFSTEEDTYVVTRERLIIDILEHLEEVEDLPHDFEYYLNK